MSKHYEQRDCMPVGSIRTPETDDINTLTYPKSKYDPNLD